EEGEDILLKRKEFMQMRDPTTGDLEGFAVIDKITNSVTMLTGERAEQAMNGMGNLPDGAAPSDIPSTMQGVYARLGDPADIVDGAGITAKIQDIGSKLLGNVFPEYAGSEVGVKRQGLDLIRAQMQAM